MTSREKQQSSQMAEELQPQAPLVSIVVACRNGEDYLEDCLRSALAQTCRRIEVVFVDDGSTDGTRGIAERLARTDPRLRLFARSVAGGPAAARNLALEKAEGEWIAILDADDMMHPQRLERLLHAAEVHGADIIADNMLVFGDPPQEARMLFDVSSDFEVDLPTYIRANRLYTKGAPLGYAKPLIRRNRLAGSALRYDESLRIGEDYDLIAHLLASGLRFWIVAEAYYFYRKHGASISHRLSTPTLEAMLVSDGRLRDVLERRNDRASLAALAERSATIVRALSFQRFVDAVKTGDRFSAARGLAGRPDVWRLVLTAYGERVTRGRARKASAASSKSPKQATIISRQRIIGPTNGSSTYVLSLASALRDGGWRVTLLAPTPRTLGRLPFIKLSPEMDVFHEIKIRGCIRVGRTLVRPDASAFWRAASGVAGRLSRRMGYNFDWLSSQPLPHSISLPWEAADLLYIANETPRSDVLLADYLFQTFALPYALQPDAKTYLIMHDLFSKRAEGFGGQAVSDSIAPFQEATEIAMLNQADTVIAIQPEEAEWVRERLPGKRVISVPMPAKLADEPQPGERRQILFVGSNTAPNVIALEWWFRDIWPSVLAACPDCETIVAGSVASADLPRPANTQFLGIVPDLGPLYSRVAVVISPLTVGSGLKIKLIDALGMGKAIVATTKTLEGAPRDVVSSVRVADEAGAFADHVISLLNDEGSRVTLAASALEAARAHYSVQACHAEWIASLKS